VTYGHRNLPTVRSTRQIRADETRSRIFDAARDLFARRGFHETTVSEIVARADVAKGTFFLHFPTKGAIAVELVQEECASARRARLRVLDGGGTPVAAIRATLLRLADHAGVSRALCRAVFAALLAHASIGDRTDEAFLGVRDDMLEDIRAAQAAGELDDSLDADLIATSLLSLYLGAAVHFANNLEKGAFVDLIDRLLDVNLQRFRVGDGGAP
jgi:AcrR family transcriptional regulator